MPRFEIDDCEVVQVVTARTPIPARVQGIYRFRSSKNLAAVSRHNTNTVRINSGSKSL